jgi:hypothetical protein
LLKSVIAGDKKRLKTIGRNEIAGGMILLALDGEKGTIHHRIVIMNDEAKQR